MIVVSVELRSATSRSRDKELARVLISNVGGTDRLGDYRVASLRGRSKDQLDKLVIQRNATVRGHPRQTEHVLNLVAKALHEMGYGVRR